jgi:hypothetical protein
VRFRASIARRAGWGIADQAASSATNFALGLFVARQTTPEGFGAFGLAFVTYLFFLNLGRAIVAQPFLIRHSNVPPDEWRAAVRPALGVAGLLGVAAGLGCLLFGFVGGNDIRPAFAALALGLPGLLTQDAWRFTFFAAGRERDALVNDLAWAVMLALTLAALAASGATDVFSITLAWGVTASVVSLGRLVQSGLKPSVGWPIAWVRAHRDLIPRFSLEVIARMGGTQLLYFILGAISGLAAVGAIRAADLLLGPFNILFQGVHLIALPEGRRLLTASTDALLRWCRFLSVTIGVGALAWGVVCLLLPDSLGRAAVGASWEPARSVLLPMIAALVGLVASAGAIVGLRALAAAKRTLRAAVVTSAATLGAATFGAALGDAPGAAWGLAIGSWIGAVVWWFELRQGLAEGPVQGPEQDPGRHDGLPSGVAS